MFRRICVSMNDQFQVSWIESNLETAFDELLYIPLEKLLDFFLQDFYYLTNSI